MEQVGFAFVSKDSRTEVLRSVEFQARPREITAILGPSGCGKTTLLKLVAGLLAPTSGRVVYSDNDRVRRAGFVFQTPSLIPWRSVYDNALLAPDVVGGRSPELVRRCDDLLRSYGLADFADRLPFELSSGMAQRVSFVRAVLSGAGMLLLDEPFVGSDWLTRRGLQLDLARLVQASDIVALLVTHDLDEAARLADRVVVLSQRPATVVATVQPASSREARLSEDEGPRLIADFLCEIQEVILGAWR